MVASRIGERGHRSRSCVGQPERPTRDVLNQLVSIKLEETVESYINTALTFGIQIGTKIIGAILLWVIGRWLIGKVGILVSRGLDRQRVDPTLVRYAGSALGILLNVILVIAVLGVFGVETTTFAGILAAAGIAIGMAWSGLLANLAAGVFMVILRPFKVGEFVTIGGITGTVREIGMFVITLDTPDNVRTFVGNNKVFGGDIQNYSANEFRRVDLQAQLAHGADHRSAIALLRMKLATIPNVISDPAPDVEILNFTLAGPVLAVRPYCHTDHYWQVYFEATRIIREELSTLELPVPQQHFLMNQAG